jgi:hypothetical protein
MTMRTPFAPEGRPSAEPARVLPFPLTRTKAGRARGDQVAVTLDGQTTVFDSPQELRDAVLAADAATQARLIEAERKTAQAMADLAHARDLLSAAQALHDQATDFRAWAGRAICIGVAAAFVVALVLR